VALNLKKTPSNKSADAPTVKSASPVKWFALALGLGGVVIGSTILANMLVPREIVHKQEKMGHTSSAPGPSFNVCTGQVVNLTGGGYLRFGCAVQFAADENLFPAGGGGSHGAAKGNPVERYEAMMKDVIVDLSSKRTAADLLSSEGKNKLKDEIKHDLNEELMAHASESHPAPYIMSVYFTEFVVQK
jgi:hypothetical protein